MKQSNNNLRGSSLFNSVVSSTLATVLFRRDRLWIIFLSAALIVLAVGWWANRSVENSVKSNIASQLETLLNADVAALKVWLESKQDETYSLARTRSVSEPVQKLVEIAADPSSPSIAADLLASDELKQLRKTMRDWGSEHGGQGFVVVDKSFRIIAGDQNSGIADPNLARGYEAVVAPVFEGETIFIPPFKSMLILEDFEGNAHAGVPVMYVVAPVFSADGSVIAAFGLRLRPEKTFSEILGVARAGETGETYAFNEQGGMITNSRFDDDLKRIGLLLDNEDSHSLLNLEIRDPGVDMTANHRPSTNRSEQPLTKMAESSLKQESGVDVDGYRDYRGVPVIGAWTWLPEYRMGVATEVDVKEAFQPLYALRRAFWLLTGFLVLAALINGWLAWFASRMEYKAREATISAKRLGQYALDEKLGEGGMGSVYRAHHDMLRRPTAVKLLNIEKTNEQTIARFEREVQLTSQLTHPNTIAIYDYGRTPEGIFFYAMEYLEGISLDEFVEKFGPQPAGRVIFILRQVCSSLAEAHGQQMIHRDIKPGNIMLTRRGGMCDFVKLLDFGLVKSEADSLNVTVADSLLGTPHYMPPEVMNRQELDARSDLYSLGAATYYLLTGSTVFDGKNIGEICMQHAKDAPEPPGKRLGKAVDEQLEQIILDCLAKDPNQRPQSANELIERLDACSATSQWSQKQADQWWSENMDGAEHEKLESTLEISKPKVAATIDQTRLSE